jgi:hypothetical protein
MSSKLYVVFITECELVYKVCFFFLIGTDMMSNSIKSFPRISVWKQHANPSGYVGLYNQCFNSRLREDQETYLSKLYL